MDMQKFHQGFQMMAQMLQMKQRGQEQGERLRQQNRALDFEEYRIDIQEKRLRHQEKEFESKEKYQDAFLDLEKQRAKLQEEREKRRSQLEQTRLEQEERKTDIQEKTEKRKLSEIQRKQLEGQQEAQNKLAEKMENMKRAVTLRNNTTLPFRDPGLKELAAGLVEQGKNIPSQYFPPQPPVQININEKIDTQNRRDEAKMKIGVRMPAFRSEVIRTVKSLVGADWDIKPENEKTIAIRQEMDKRIKAIYGEDVVFDVRDGKLGWYDMDGKLIRTAD